MKIVQIKRKSLPVHSQVLVHLKNIESPVNMDFVSCSDSSLHISVSSNYVFYTKFVSFYSQTLVGQNHISGIMANVLASSEVDCGFEPQSGQIWYLLLLF